MHAQRDRPAFTAVFNEYAPYVWRVLRRLGVDQADVEDVCQEVFMVVHRRLPEFEGRSSLRTWLYAICVRRAGNYRTRAVRRHEVLNADRTDQAFEPTQLDQLERTRALRWLDRVLAELPPAQRDVYVLYELEQMTMQEVADVVGCPLQTAYSRLHAARRCVQRAVAPQKPRLRAL
jgi:RNA polymerase sigma-70 factor, ECF subfamily